VRSAEHARVVPHLRVHTREVEGETRLLCHVFHEHLGRAPVALTERMRLIHIGEHPGGPAGTLLMVQSPPLLTGDQLVHLGQVTVDLTSGDISKPARWALEDSDSTILTSPTRDIQEQIPADSTQVLAIVSLRDRNLTAQKLLRSG